MSNVSHGSSLREHVLMVRRFLRSPGTIGAVSASSRTMARGWWRACRRPSAEHRGTGARHGAFTRAIVARVARGSRILAIDLEQTFVDRLRGLWPTVDCVCGSAVDLERLVGERRMAPVDHIISGLPFASLPVDVTRPILDGIERTSSARRDLHDVSVPARIRAAARTSVPGDMSARMGGQPERRLVLSNFPFPFILTWTRPARA